jgi:hypothetical protein
MIAFYYYIHVSVVSYSLFNGKMKNNLDLRRESHLNTSWDTFAPQWTLFVMLGTLWVRIFERSWRVRGRAQESNVHPAGIGKAVPA